MLRRDLADDAPPRMVVERPREGFEVGDVVQHVVAHHDVRGLHAICDIGPRTRQGVVRHAGARRQFVERGEHLFGLIDGDDPTGAARERE